MTTIGASRNGVLVLAKIAPFLGGVVFVSSLEATAKEADIWVDLWRVGMSVGLGVFVTLVGAIYQNLNKRLERIEIATKNDFVPRQEYDSRHEDVKDQLNRIENAIISHKL